MTKLTRPTVRKGNIREEQLPSSPGINSASVTPKDVSAQDATSRDIVERHIATGPVSEHMDELLDDAVDLTFPASDPIAISSPTRINPAGRIG